jgi:hypothetical protein
MQLVCEGTVPGLWQSRIHIRASQDKRTMPKDVPYELKNNVILQNTPIRNENYEI